MGIATQKELCEVAAKKGLPSKHIACAQTWKKGGFLMTDEEIRRAALQESDYVVQCRRAFHRFAEISGTEVQTSAYVQRELEALGLTVQSVSPTGLLAMLDTGRVGPCIALRADLDALPLPEEPNNLVGPRTCVSENPNTCHACGHDAHAAMLLGAARILMAHKDNLCGRICLCFEEGEETGRGVQGMLNALEPLGVDTCWAIHVYAELDSGLICVDAGARMAGAAGIDITIRGKGGHASRPDLAANPVFCAAAVLTNAATAWVNQIPAGETVTLGVTGIQSGKTSNVIEETAVITGSMRFFEQKQGEKALAILRSVAEHTAAMHGCRAEWGPRLRVVIGPVQNDPVHAALAQEALRRGLPEGAVASCPPWYASEPFSAYAQRYPSVMAHLGIRNTQRGTGAPHHNGFFDVDEDVLPLGVMATLQYVAAVQQQWQNASGSATS